MKFKRSVTNTFIARRSLSRLAIFVLLGTLALGSQSHLLAQESSRTRFTESLRLEEIAPGIEYGQTQPGRATDDESTGPWLINVLRVDLGRARIKVARALDEGVGVETVSSLALRHQATAAINGGYFRLTGPYRGESIGLLLLDGKLMSEPYNERAAIGLSNYRGQSQLLFGHLKFSGEIRVGSARRSMQGLNRPVSPDELIVFTPAFHRTTLTNADGVEVIVRGSRVVSVNDLTGSSNIPADGFVISAMGQSREWIKKHVRRGARISFSAALKPVEISPAGHLWMNSSALLGGGPQLIRNGKVAITAKEEKMRDGFDAERHPRTAIAKLSSGKVLLVTVDGRQPGVSAGMSLYMLAHLLLELGAIAAINLDGGGSTTMVIHNKIVNRPSDQTGERPVGDAILIFPKQN